mgnify:CR=1 FL=1
MVKSTALGLWQFFLINQNLKDKSVEVVMCGDFFAEILYVFVSILGFSKNTEEKEEKATAIELASNMLYYRDLFCWLTFL